MRVPTFVGDSSPASPDQNDKVRNLYEEKPSVPAEGVEPSLRRYDCPVLPLNYAGITSILPSLTGKINSVRIAEHAG